MKLKIDITKDLLENLTIKRTGILVLLGKAILEYKEEYKILNDIINLKDVPEIEKIKGEILEEAFFKEKTANKKGTVINISDKKKILIEKIIGKEGFIKELLINQPIKVRSFIIEETLKLYKGEDNVILKIRRELERLKQEQGTSNNPEPNKAKEEPVKDTSKEKKSDGGIDLSNIIVF